MLARHAVVLGVIVVAAAAATAGCSAHDEGVGASDDEIKVDTSSPAARQQYDANVTFANGYVARCTGVVAEAADGGGGAPRRPRVLVTGFGRFMSIDDNATGRIISTLVPDAHYPETHAPEAGQIDPPEPQLSVALSTLDLPGVGEVDVCAMILPVYWDMAAILIAKEADAFAPDFVMMNGVAGDRQPIWIELGATNRASTDFDGSNQLRPAVVPGDSYVKIVESAPASEDARGNLLSWRSVEAAANEAVARHAADVDGDERFDALLPGVALAGYPRSSNTYLCNNVTYVTGWLMGHPNKDVRLLRASKPLPHVANDVKVRIKRDLSKVPRVFVHWPTTLAGKHHEAGADVMRSILSAQLKALHKDSNDAPTIGDNALADPTLQGGAFF